MYWQHIRLALGIALAVELVAVLGLGVLVLLWKRPEEGSNGHL